jgi:DsbC/DsbD-like thiol-disulfide interchange protein
LTIHWRLQPKALLARQSNMVVLIRRKLLLMFCVMLIFAARSSAQLPADSHAKLELIAEQNFAPSGGPLWIGLLFRLDAGWHIYWQNPGDSGEPPKVQWQLPPGFAAGPIRWPQPIRLGGGTVVDYGYEGQVLLMAPIEAASKEHATSISGLSADVKYIVCREMCIPGSAHLTLALPPGGDWGRRRALFGQTRQQLPKPAPSGWKVSAETDKSHLIVSVRGAPQVQGASFFPLEAGQIDNSSPQSFASNRAGFRLTIRKSDQLIKPISTLRGLIVLGPERAFEVAAPVISR